MADVAIQVLVEAEVKRALRDVQEFGRGASKSISRLEEANRRLQSVGRAATIGLTVPIVALGRSFLTAAADAEVFEASFETMLRSAERGRDLFEEIEAFAAATPFRIPELAQASQQLLAFGTAQEEVIERLEEIGNLSLGTADKLQRLVLAYGKVQAKGRATMEEINQFTEAGVPLLQALAGQLGVTEQELFKLIETGRIGFPEVQDAVTALSTGTGQFAGGMERASQTLAGLLSTLQDNISLAGQELVESLIDPLKDAAEVATRAAQAFGELDEGMRKVALGAGFLLAAIGPLAFGAKGLIGLGQQLVKLGKWLAPLAAAHPLVAGVLAGLAALTAGFFALTREARAAGRALQEASAALDQDIQVGTFSDDPEKVFAAIEGHNERLRELEETRRILIESMLSVRPDLDAASLRSLSTGSAQWLRELDVQIEQAAAAAVRLSEAHAALSQATRSPDGAPAGQPAAAEWMVREAEVATELAGELARLERRYVAFGDEQALVEGRAAAFSRALEQLADWVGETGDSFVAGGQTLARYVGMLGAAQESLQAFDASVQPDVLAPFSEQLAAADRNLQLFGDGLQHAQERVGILEAALRAVAASDLDLDAAEVRQLQTDLAAARAELERLSGAGPPTAVELLAQTAADAEQALQQQAAATQALHMAEQELQAARGSGAENVALLEHQVGLLQQLTGATEAAGTAQGLFAQVTQEVQQAQQQLAVATEAVRMAEEELQRAKQAGADPQQIAMLERTVELLTQMKDAAADAVAPWTLTFDTIRDWAGQAAGDLQATFRAITEAQEREARHQVELLRRSADEKERILRDAKREADDILRDQIRSLKASYDADEINLEEYDARLADLQDARTKRYGAEADAYADARNAQLMAAYDAEVAAFKARKQAALIQIAIDTALAVARTLGSIPFPFSVIPAGLAAVAGGVQLAVVASQQPPPPPELVQLQRGGIVTGPTHALIGEAGPEAVIPLDRPGIAPTLGGQTIQVTVYVTGSVMTGDDLARQIAQSIRRQQERGRIAPWRD